MIVLEELLQTNYQGKLQRSMEYIASTEIPVRKSTIRKVTNIAITMKLQSFIHSFQ